MGLEAVMLCIDNSEWTRNGDFKPSRFEGQTDAANLVCEAKTQQNPESTLGMMTMAGKRPEIYLTQTNDVGRLIQTLQKMPISGYMDLVRAVKIAQLSLKHRQNKNQKQRIVVFIGSPIEGLEEKDMKKLGKQLRKNEVALDVVNFGHPENMPLLTALVDNCNKNGNSHLVEINYGMNIADSIITSPVVAFDSGYDAPAEGAAEGAGAGAGNAPGGGAGGQWAEYGGFDPNLDPELAMAIRISLEEAKNAGNDANKDNKDQPEKAEGDAGQQPDTPGDVDMKKDDQNQNMEQDEEEDYDAALEEAKRLSMEGYTGEEPAQQQTDGQNAGGEEDFEFNKEFLGELMNDLGVPMDDAAIDDCLGDEKKDEKDKDKDKKDENK